MQLRWLDAGTIAGLIDTPAVVEAVERAFMAYGRGEARMPPKVYLEVPRGDFRAMPAYLPGAAGIKWVNVHPANPARPEPLPTVMALIILSDPETGAPRALMDGTVITRLRTGGAAAVATRALMRPDARTLGIVGCGGQALAHIAAIAHVMRPSEILLADLKRENAERLAALWTAQPCRVVGDEEACGADVVTTLTASRAPFVRREWIRPGAHVNAMGADAPGKQELALDLLLAARVFYDNWEQASHSGEINVGIARDALIEGRPPLAGALPDVLCGRLAGRQSSDEITVFDSTGLAIQDLALAQIVFERATARGMGQLLEEALPR